MTSNRKSDIMVTVIDGEEFGKIVREKVGDKLPKEATLRTLGKYGFVKTKKGTFILDDDGTGQAESVEEKPSAIEFTREDVMELMPCINLPINASQIDGIPVLAEKVNLAHFIRRFGNRLECNFDEWNKFLTKAEPV